MLVLRLLVMVLTIICLMDGHAEVSSSTTGIRDRRESPAVKTNELEVEDLDRKKKKKPKPSKKKKPKPGKKKPKPNKAKPKPTKPVTTTTTMSTSTLKTTTILTTPTITTTTTTTTTTVSPTTTETTVKTTPSTASATKTLSTTTTTTVATSSTASTTTTTIPTTATTSSLPTTTATTADSGAGGECKATNGKPCIFPFKDGNEEYNECKNEGGKYFWCATSVYDSGKYKHWSYCSTDGPCPLEGDDGECRATNNKPCVFPFKDGNKEYNECADHGGKYFWCATGTNSAGKYTAWSECPKDGSCPLPPKSTAPAMTSTATGASTTAPTTGTSKAPDEIENKVFNSLTDLVKEESKDGTLEMLETMNKMTQTIIEDMKGQNGDNDPKNIKSNHTFIGGNPPSQEIYLGYKQGIDFGETRKIDKYFEYDQNSVDWIGSYTRVLDPSDCCSKCRSIPKMSNTEIFDYFHSTGQCYCYKKYPSRAPKRKINYKFSAGECDLGNPLETCSLNRMDCPDGYVKQTEGSLYTYKPEGVSNKLSKCDCRTACERRQPTCIGFRHIKEGNNEFCILLKESPPGGKVPAPFCLRLGEGGRNPCETQVSAQGAAQVAVATSSVALYNPCGTGRLNPGSLVKNTINGDYFVNRILNKIESFSRTCSSKDVARNENEYGSLAFATKDEIPDQDQIQWLNRFDPYKAGLDAACEYYTKPSQMGGSDFLFHVEDILMDRIRQVRNNGQYKEWFLYTRNSPCAYNSFTGRDRDTCLYKIMRFVSDELPAGARLTIAFRQWWTYDDKSNINVEQWRDHFCARVKHYRELFEQEGINFDARRLRFIYFLQDSRCPNDYKWAPDANC